MRHTRTLTCGLLVLFLLVVTACNDHVVDALQPLDITFNLTPRTTTVAPGDTVSLTYASADPVLQDLDVEWIAEAGSLRAQPGKALWTAPDQDGQYTIMASVYDHRPLKKPGAKDQPVATQSVTMTVASDTVYITQKDTVKVPEQILIVDLSEYIHASRTASDTGISLSLSVYGAPIPTIRSCLLNGISLVPQDTTDHNDWFIMGVRDSNIIRADSITVQVTTDQGMLSKTLCVLKAPSIPDTLDNTQLSVPFAYEGTLVWTILGARIVTGDPVTVTDSSQIYDFSQVQSFSSWFGTEASLLFPKDMQNYLGTFDVAFSVTAGVPVVSGAEPNMQGVGSGYIAWRTYFTSMSSNYVWGARDLPIQTQDDYGFIHTFSLAKPIGPRQDASVLDRMRDAFVPAAWR